MAFHITQDPIHGDVAPAMGQGNSQGCAPLGVVYPLQEVGKRESKDQNGVGIGGAGGADPMYTLQAGAQHGVAVTAPCLRSNVYNNSDPGMEAQMVVPFDTTQMTSALNQSQPKAGDPCHPLAAGAHRNVTNSSRYFGSHFARMICSFLMPPFS